MAHVLAIDAHDGVARLEAGLLSWTALERRNDDGLAIAQSHLGAYAGERTSQRVLLLPEGVGVQEPAVAGIAQAVDHALYGAVGHLLHVNCRLVHVVAGDHLPGLPEEAEGRRYVGWLGRAG